MFSMVRSNSQGDVGFLSEQRRNNVAITRARRLLCVDVSCVINLFLFQHELLCAADASSQTVRPCRVTGLAAYSSSSLVRACVMLIEQVHASAGAAYERKWRPS